MFFVVTRSARLPAFPRRFLPFSSSSKNTGANVAILQSMDTRNVCADPDETSKKKYG
jgi:hypothetical protein